MTIQTATPYLILGGRAVEAVSFYEHALGAERESLQRFGDVQHDCPVALRDWVMHAVLKVGNARLMLSDGTPGSKPAPGGTVNVALHFTSEARARTAFDLLSEGGTVVQPLIEAPWGGYFGALQDRFGVNWMFDAKKD